MCKFEYIQKLKSLYLRYIRLGYTKLDAYRKAQADMRLPSLIEALTN